jgi:prepilin-type N-terminal cleavage/methylation domain-containing protein
MFRPFTHKRPSATYDVRGFTIIEVMIVLAIAGIILAIVLIAVPSVQKSARDNGRKQTALLVSAELDEYRDTHGLQYPAVDQRCAFIKTYLQQFVSPSAACVDGGCTDGVYVQGYAYNFCFHQADTSPHSYLSTNADEISIQTGHWCNYAIGTSSNTGDPITSTSADTDLRYGVVWVPLERTRLFCADNH